MGTSRALIGGAVHRIIEGRTLIGGTAYTIYQGKTLIGGTAKNIILVDFINAIPKMTSNTAGASPGGTCSDSASSKNAFKVFDNSNTTTDTFSFSAARGTTYTHWSQYVVPAGYALQFNGLNVRVNRTSTNLSAFTWTVKISQNGSTWTSIATGTDAHNGAVSLTQTYVAKYIRLETSVTYSRAVSSVSISHYHVQTSMCSGCSNTCTGGCSGTCSGCGNNCVGTCTGCGSDCSGTCQGSCEGCTGCSGGCGSNCWAVCNSGCSDGCTYYCASSCAAGCVSGCADMCYGVEQ